MAELSAAKGEETTGDPRVEGAAAPGGGVLTLVIFAAIILLSTANRNVVSVLVAPIQKAMHVNDAAMGALAGMSFTLVYATVAFPMARLADRGNRRSIVAVAVLIWSVMTALCGAAANYLLLFLGRMGVAVGEACAYPAQMSMVGDLFPLERRGGAISVIWIGSAIGTAFGAYAAGRLNDLYGWQVVFFAFGAPGLLVVLALLAFVREPLRDAHGGGEGAAAAVSSTWREDVVRLAAIPSAGVLLLAGGVLNLAFFVSLAWLPAFLMRTEGLSATAAGGIFGAASSPAILGILAAGFISDRLAAKAPRRRLQLMAALLAAAVPALCVMLITRDPKVFFAAMVVYAFLTGPSAALLPAAYLDVTPSRLCGSMMAASRFCADVIGGGLGPLAVGALSDALKPAYGAEALRYALITIPAGMALAALTLLWSARYADQDARAAAGG
ncbi:MAG: MFS transporter [Caulobacteraceae bacterium]|nr:MFS transporter [Caulobacteraceae bacterium]